MQQTVTLFMLLFALAPQDVTQTVSLRPWSQTGDLKKRDPRYIGYFFPAPDFNVASLSRN